MGHPDLAVVTGAFGYTGGYIARRLIDRGVRVRTLSRRPAGRSPLGALVETVPLDFSDPDGLCRSIEGAGVLYNTYWIRYARGRMTFDRAVENSGTLFEAAVRAGVGRIVHLSVSNPSHDSRLPYFRGKAQVEEMLKGLGVSYAVIRPTLIYGGGDLLLNNIAWALRRFPVFLVYGSGDYPVQPVFVEDVAVQAVDAGSQGENVVADAAGPEIFSFEELLRLLASAMGVRARLVHAPPTLGLALTQLVGRVKGDLALTRDEVEGLMAGLLTSRGEPTGATKLSDWLKENADGLGRSYVSELRRNWRLSR
ncbi:MAG: NAD(P)H-binding protein [Chloroflexota bacterium]|nr:NAD(P)H-binding protein [Chloroflexota bacterium]MDE2940810.1 NAD(P)H-binding protein [Chloroflexota bacterium]MDE3267600.1 NAD(P)H-binding protein [Chloroflexota bacterium]